MNKWNWKNHFRENRRWFCMIMNAKTKNIVHLAGNYCHSHLNSISNLTLQNVQTGCTLDEDAKVAFWNHSFIFLIPCQCSFRSNEYRWNFRFVKILWVMIFADLAECPVYAKITFRNSSETIVHLKRINLLVRHNKIIADVPNITQIKGKLDFFYFTHAVYGSPDVSFKTAPRVKLLSICQNSTS